MNLKPSSTTTSSSATLRLCARIIAFIVPLIISQAVHADQELLKAHCAKCHSGSKPKGDFTLQSLTESPSKENVELWKTSLDYVKAGEMPPAKQSRLSKTDRQRLVRFLEEKLQLFKFHFSQILFNEGCNVLYFFLAFKILNSLEFLVEGSDADEEGEAVEF